MLEAGGPARYFCHLHRVGAQRLIATQNRIGSGSSPASGDRRVSGSGLRFAYEENLMPEKYKGFTFEASAVAVAPGEFRGAALIFKDGSIVWREPNATSFPTEAEA